MPKTVMNADTFIVKNSLLEITLIFVAVVNCGDPGIPINGNRIITTLTVGSTVVFTCDSGYKLSGATTARCENTGQWSASPPTCTPTGSLNSLEVTLFNSLL